MKHNALGAAAVAALLILPLSCSNPDDGVEALFNGKDLTGWTVVLKEGEEVPETPTFQAVDGVLRVSGKPFGYMRTDKKYSNYHLMLEWRWAGDEGVDGGIFNYLQDGDKVWPTGIQFQMTPKDMGDLFGGIPIEGIEGPFYWKKRPVAESQEKPVGEWNTMEFYSRDGHLTAYLNGVLVNEITCEAREGYIGIQSEGGAMELRNIRIDTLTSARRPPLTPAWALGQIVWEDEWNTEESATRLVQGYLDRDIPVSGIIIDSPWETSYNDCHWDTDRYPDPAGMIGGFKDKGVHTLLWITGCLNGSESDEDCPVVKSGNFDEAVEKGYVVNDGEEREWWKGKGVHIDFTNPEAVQWWYGQLDKILLPGVDGFKVDQGELSVGSPAKTSVGEMTNHQFRPYYYDAMFDYVGARRPGTGMILARPWSFQGVGGFSSPEKLTVGWCGDYDGDWGGLKFQIENIYRSALAGYGACGTEVGGFMGPTPTKAQLLRYAQFGAMTATMVNGGMNGPFEGHLAWWHDEEAETIYREVVKLHYSLIPYIFSTLVDAHLEGGTLLQKVSLSEESHLLGPDLFTKAITSDDNHVTFTLPSDGEWVDWRTKEVFADGTVIDRDYPLDEFPLFVRKGSILPLQEADGIRFLVTPGTDPMEVSFHLPAGEGTDYYDCTVTYDPAKDAAAVHCDRKVPYAVEIIR